MAKPLKKSRLRRLLQQGKIYELVKTLDAAHPHDAAKRLARLELGEICQILALLPGPLTREVFDFFEHDVQEQLVLTSRRDDARDLLADMASDDRAELIEGLDRQAYDQVYPLLSESAKEDLLRRERFARDQIGAVVDIDYCVLDGQQTAEQAIDSLRRQAATRETIYHSYVVDDANRLIGTVSLRDLIVAPADTTVGAIMATEVVTITAGSDREDAARRLREYDLLALPVVDEAGCLVGIITHDDAADILEEEEVEDIEIIAGITGEAEDDSYLDASVASHFRRRVVVLAVLAVSFVFIAAIIQGFEGVLEGGPTVIVALLPMIMATGGNVGNQASTAVILALKHELQPGQFASVLWKELRISLGLGLVLCTIAGLEAAWLIDPAYGNVGGVCLAVSLALALHVVTAALLGAMIPLALAALRLQVAMVAHPALATIADLSGVVIYFLTISLLVPLAGP